MQPTDRQALVSDLAGAAHVWYLETGPVTDPAVLERCTALLSNDEAERYRRFRFDNDRRLFLLSHAMLRLVLSHYDDVDPADWQYSLNAHGRPEIALPAPGIPLRFNLTHTQGLAACIVTHTLDCGVDAEEVVVRRHARGIAERMFADEELQALRGLEGPDLLDEFVSLWTLREAYCKACGTGLGNSGKHFRFARGRDDEWRIHFAADSPTGDDWYVSVRRVAGTHMVAVAVNAVDRPAPPVRFREFTF